MPVETQLGKKKEISSPPPPRLPPALLTSDRVRYTQASNRFESRNCPASYKWNSSRCSYFRPPKPERVQTNVPHPDKRITPWIDLSIYLSAVTAPHTNISTYRLSCFVLRHRREPDSQSVSLPVWLFFFSPSNPDSLSSLLSHPPTPTYVYIHAETGAGEKEKQDATEGAPTCKVPELPVSFERELLYTRGVEMKENQNPGSQDSCTKAENQRRREPRCTFRQFILECKTKNVECEMREEIFGWTTDRAREGAKQRAHG